jgi:hypothetical protein
MTEKASEIAVLEAKVKALRTELADYENLLHNAKVAAAGVSLGDIVLHKGKRYRVSSIDPYWSPAWLKGNPERKDGTFGAAERHLFDRWERIEP